MTAYGILEYRLLFLKVETEIYYREKNAPH